MSGIGGGYPNTLEFAVQARCHRSNGTIKLGQVPNSLIEPTAAKGKVLALLQVPSSTIQQMSKAQPQCCNLMKEEL